jgi:ATP phosphoribosyltransferase
MVREHEVDSRVEEVLPLGFGKCRLCIAGPKKENLRPEDLIGKRIVTSFPRLTRWYFKEKFKTDDIQIREIAGSVEIAPTLGTAEAVVDLVETGSTLREAGLEVLDVILKTQAVLISRKELDKREEEWLERLKTRLHGVLTAEKYLILDYNISKNRLKQAEKITPGMKSPTIMPLDQEDWVAVRSVIEKKEMYKVIEELKEAGAEAILVSQMEYFQR